MIDWNRALSVIFSLILAVSMFAGFVAISPQSVSIGGQDVQVNPVGTASAAPGGYDISEVTIGQNASLQDSDAGGVAWNNDGTKMYEIGEANNLIYEYDVSTPFDVTTATFSQSISAQDAEPRGITWNNDGTKMYEVGQSSNLIYEYDVSTPFDISTATFSNSISTQDTDPMGMAWNNDGTKMYEVGFGGGGNVYTYDLTTPYDTSTATFSHSISSQDAVPTGMVWNNDGTKMYELGFSSENIHEYTVSTPYNTTTATLSQTIPAQDTGPTDIAWDDVGSKLYEVGGSSQQIYEYSFSTAYDISTGNFAIPTQDSQPMGMSWNNDGTKMYEIGQGSDLIYEYTLTSAYNISTATYTGRSISTQDTIPGGMAWNNDGTKMYEIGQSSNLIYEYDVSTPYNISTATFNQSISTQNDRSGGLTWNNDGTKLYEAGDNGGIGFIYEYDVSTPYDISTATYSGTSFDTQDFDTKGMAWNDDGTKMYDIAITNDVIQEYTLSTSFDISSATFSQSTSSQDGVPMGLTWSSDGTKMYEVGQNSGYIYEYSLPSSATSTTTTSTSSTSNSGPAFSQGFELVTHTPLFEPETNVDIFISRHDEGAFTSEWQFVDRDTFDFKNEAYFDVTDGTVYKIEVIGPGGDYRSWTGWEADESDTSVVELVVYGPVGVPPPPDYSPPPGIDPGDYGDYDGDGVIESPPPIESPVFEVPNATSGDSKVYLQTGVFFFPGHGRCVGIRYWDPSYETTEITYDFDVHGTQYADTTEIDEPVGYYEECISELTIGPDFQEMDGNLSDGHYDFSTIRNGSEFNATYYFGSDFEPFNESGGVAAIPIGGSGGSDLGTDSPLGLLFLIGSIAGGWSLRRFYRAREAPPVELRGMEIGWPVSPLTLSVWIVATAMWYTNNVPDSGPAIGAIGIGIFAYYEALGGDISSLSRVIPGR